MMAKDLKGSISYWADVITSAASNITHSKLRSALTIAIVALGITCLVGTQTAIDCLAGLLSSAFSGGGERISITAAKAVSGSVSGKKNPGINYLEASQFASSYSGAGEKSVYTYVPPGTAVRLGATALGPQTTVLACEGDWLACNGLGVSLGRGTGGRFMGDECIVGSSVARQLSRRGSSRQAIGQSLQIGGKSYVVVGQLQQQSSLLGAIADNTVFIPIGSALGSLISESGSYSIDLAVSKNAKASAGSGEGPKLGGRAAGEGDGAGTVAEISALMHRIRRLGPGEDADYEIIEGSAAEREIGRLSGSLSGIALIIGLLTLIGAAVALTNIMLICVSERTREVGIRRALGATRADIRKAYIVEAVIICQAGCIAGTLLGIICGNALGLYLHTDSSIPWDWVLASQAISIAVGIAACALPARRAATMNPVTALRSE